MEIFLMCYVTICCAHNSRRVCLRSPIQEYCCGIDLSFKKRGVSTLDAITSHSRLLYRENQVLERIIFKVLICWDPSLLLNLSVFEQSLWSRSARAQPKTRVTTSFLWKGNLWEEYLCFLLMAYSLVFENYIDLVIFQVLADETWLAQEK